MPSAIKPSPTGRMRNERPKVRVHRMSRIKKAFCRFIDASQFKCELFIVLKNLMLANFNL